MESFNERLRGWVLDGCRLALDVLAGQEVLEFLPYEFVAIVMTAFRGSGVSTKPIFVKFIGAAS
jgi:hypothetical protein